MEARCLVSLRTCIGLFVQSVILYSFLYTPPCGTLLTYDLTSVGLPFSTSELEEEQCCY